MTRDEWNELAAALAASWQQSGPRQGGASSGVEEDTVEAAMERAVRLVIPAQDDDAVVPVPSDKPRSAEVQSARTDSPVEGAESLAARAVTLTGRPESPAAPAVTPVAALLGSTPESVAVRAGAGQAEVRARQALNVRPAAAIATRSSSADAGSSAATEMLKIAGMVTGVGPIVTGLIKLFGGGGTDKQNDATGAPVRYELPQAVNVNAGLTPGRSMAQLSYAQNNQVRADVLQASDESARAATGPTMPPIQIQVNALDSRSFMDHSDEIAQAVRAAMLRSHAINDVISEV